MSDFIYFDSKYNCISSILCEIGIFEHACLQTHVLLDKHLQREETSLVVWINTSKVDYYYQTNQISF